jgi:hypothetical protein
LQGTEDCYLKTLQIASTIFTQSVNLLNGLGILHGRLENPLWVNLFLQTVRPSLPAFTDKQTFSESYP